MRRRPPPLLQYNRPPPSPPPPSGPCADPEPKRTARCRQQAASASALRRTSWGGRPAFRASFASPRTIPCGFMNRFLRLDGGNDPSTADPSSQTQPSVLNLTLASPQKPSPQNSPLIPNLGGHDSDPCAGGAAVGGGRSRTVSAAETGGDEVRRSTG